MGFQQDSDSGSGAGSGSVAAAARRAEAVEQITARLLINRNDPSFGKNTCSSQMFVSDSEMGRTELTSRVLVLVGTAAAQTGRLLHLDRWPDVQLRVGFKL